MGQTNVPDELIRAATKIRWAAVGHVEFADEVRLMLAAVLPLYRRQIRAAIAVELDAHATECASVAEGYMGERSPLWDEAKYFAAAARYVRSSDGD